MNGSGKHNNWSVVTDTGVNLFDPGDDPESNLPFMCAFACVIKAVDEYADMLMMSVSSAGNDFRLGGHEAPPSIMSIFIGEELSEVVQDWIDGVFRSFRLSQKIRPIVTVQVRLLLPVISSSSVRSVPVNLFRVRIRS